MAFTRFSKMAALALLAGSMATEHHVHEREANPAEVRVTVQQTYYVTAGHQDAPSSVVAAVNQAVSQAVETVSSEAPSSSPAKETSATPSPAESSAAASESSTAPSESSSSSESSSAPSASGSGSASPSGSAGSSGALGVTYTPYSKTGGCKTSDEVSTDLAKLTGYEVIRLYGTDCNQVANVYNAKSDGQKLFLGVFDVSDIQGSIQAMHDGINGDWGSVHTVNIGNELVNDGTASVGQVSKYVDQGRSQLKSLGYSGPVVTVDTFIATINNPDLCKVSDYIAINAHAFFDGNVAADGAGEWTVQQIQRVASACGDKKVVVTEAGWPSQGNSNNKAVPSEQNQRSAISSIKKSCGNDVLLFTAFNDPWKAPGAFAAEQYWGINGAALS